jgi:hypothetical protein
MSVSTLFIALAVFNSLSFIAYGMSCLVSPRMRSEFQRYHIPEQRVIVGVLEIAGACGLLAGFRLPVIGVLAASGLAILMVLGLFVRLSIKDAPLKLIPALAYAILSLYLVYGYYELGLAGGQAG